MVLAGLVDLETPRPDLQKLVDYIVIRISSPTKSRLASARRVASNLVWGVWSTKLSNKSSSVVKQQGGDFYVIPDIDLPASLLNNEEIGKIAVVSTDLPDELCQSIGDLPIEAVLVSGLETKVELTLRDLMTIKMLGDSISKPMMVIRSGSLTEADLVMLQDAGVNGIILDLDEASLKDVEEVRDLLETIPQRKARKDIQTSAVGKPAVVADNVDYEDYDE